MSRVFKFVYLSFVLWLLWMVFAGSWNSQEMITGAVVAVVVAFLRGSMQHPMRKAMAPRFKSFVYAAMYVPYLFWSIILSNLDVAKRVIRPTLDINPGIVKVRTRLKSPVARMILANSITLTPGTLSVDIAGDDMYIHWIDVESQDATAATKKIVEGFEKYLEVIFG
jgi:multicomponent Na+:H+ antiporter subunit E